MGFTYPIPNRWHMCTISYSIPRCWTAISCGQCRNSNMIYYAEMHRQTFEKLTWLKGTYQGRIQDFKLRGAYLKKLRRVEGGAKIFGVIEKEDFEVNCLYKTRWDSYPGIGEEKKSFLLKKTDPTFYTPFLFIKYSKTTHWKHHIHVIIQNVKKWGIFSIEKKYGAFIPSYVF